MLPQRVQGATGWSVDVLTLRQTADRTVRNTRYE
jgi:hypothetical protein